MKNNYKLILCLLVVIIASLSCVGASEDVDTSLTTGNNGDTSVNHHSDVVGSGSDEAQLVNSIENGNNNNGGGVDLEATYSGDSDTSQEKKYNDSAVYTSSDIKQATKNVSISNENKVNLYSTIATTYASGETKNFTDLQGSLNSTTNLYLNNTKYIYNGTGDTILNITNKTSNITVDGSNASSGGSAIIDGNNSVILKITGSNVTLKNIIFQNGKTNSNQYIIELDSNSNVTFINCSFKDNTINSSYGSVVHVVGNATFINTSFINTTVTSNVAEGAAVYIVGNTAFANFTGCNFTNNNAGISSGGAVYIQFGNATFSDCNFNNNSAASAGAIHLQNGTVNFTSCNFTHNNAKGVAGAVLIGDKGTFTDCNFNNNSALVAGAVHLQKGNVSFDGCNFTGNGAVAGAALYIQTGKGKLNNCNFKNNKGETNSQGYSLVGQGPNGTGVFNNVSDSVVAALSVMGYSSITDNEENNHILLGTLFGLIVVGSSSIGPTGAIKNGGGTNINNGNSSGLVANAGEMNFTGNNTGLINNGGNMNLTVNNSGVINSLGNFTTFNLSDNPNQLNFSSSNASMGAGVYVQLGDVKFNGCSFINNTADSGAGVYVGANRTAIFNNTKFDNNTALANGKLGNGSAVYISENNQSIIFVNSSFTGNEGDLGTVYMHINSTASFDDCNFTANKADQGGAVYMSTNTTANFTGVRFVNNSAVYGGVVYISTNATGRFVNCTFINNTATEGGVAYINDDTNTPPSESAKVLSYAVALFSTDNNNGFNKGLGLFDGCTFEDNSASDKGGVIYNDGAMNVTNSSMDNNSANSGGVVYVSSTGNGNITNSSLTNNNAGLAGGALYNEGLVNVSGSDFENNTATLSAGAIYTNNDANITNNKFSDNSASAGNGGGIAVYGGNTNLTGSNFTANAAPNGEGGAVYIGSRGNTTLNNINFADNTAFNGASLYSAGEMSLNNVETDIPLVNVGMVDDANLTILSNRTIDVYSDHIDIYAKLDQDINTTLYFQITTNDTSSRPIYIRATYLGNATYYARFDITQFGQTYTVSAPSIISGIKNLTVKNATLISIDQFSIDITANNVTVTDVNSTANNTIDIYILNGNNVLEGNVTVLVNGEEFNVDLYRSQGKLTLENLTPGQYNITVIYGNGNATVNGSTVFYVQYPVNINDTNIVFKDNGDNTTTVTIEFPPDATGNVTITVNGTEYNATIEDGTATFIVNGTFTDFADVSIYYPGNNVTGSFNQSIVLDLRDIQLTIDGSTVTAGDNSTVNVGLIINDVPADENVTITVTGVDYEETFNATVVDGNAVLDLGVLKPGAYNVTVQYSNKVASTVVYVKNNITQEDITIEASKNANGTADLTVTAPEGMTGNITFNIGGKNYTAEIINGTATVSTDQPYDEPFQVSIYYAGNDANYAFNYTYNIDTSKVTVTVENVTMYYRNGSGVVVNVGMGDTPLSNQTVYITINNRTYNRTTGADGSAKLTVNLNPGVYNVTTTYTGADGQNYTVESTVTVLSTISGENIVKYYRNATRYYATFLDGQGSPLAHKNVTFNINGVFYTALTDDNGTASLAINLLPDKYIITAYNPVNNESYSNNVTVLTTLETGNLVKYFRNGSQFTAKVTDGTGNAASGVLVTFNINGVFYSKYSDANGLATLNINLNPGDYIITTNNTLTGQTIGNTVKVLPVLTGEDLTKVYGQPAYYVAHLVDSQGNPSSNQQVTFNINGRMYHAFTDANGDARLAINLMPGRYIVTAYAGSASNSNVVTVVGGA